MSLWKNWPGWLRVDTTSRGLGREAGDAPTRRVYVGTRDLGIWEGWGGKDKDEKKIKENDTFPSFFVVFVACHCVLVANKIQ